MLRITRRDGPDRTITVQAEGKLVGPWVDELRRACAGLGGAEAARLDLGAVTYADAAGVALVRELLGRGLALGPCSGLVAALLHGGDR
jgi:hypothetical protein